MLPQPFRRHQEPPATTKFGVKTSRIRLARSLMIGGTTLLAGFVATADAYVKPPSFIFVLAESAAASPVTPSPANDRVRTPERTFIVQGLENSRQEAELSRLAIGQATSAEIRELAHQLVTDYQQINTALETLARRKSVEVPVQPVSFSDQYRDLAERSGSEFDRAYIREIMSHNTRALRLCESAVGSAKDQEIRDLAGSLLPIIRDHVNKTSDIEKSL